MKFELYDKKVIDNCFYVHNCFGSFYRGVLDWYADKFYQRFNYKVISTYDKAVEFFKKKKEIGHEVNAPILPSITLDPGLDFSPDERAGRFLWQYSTLAPGMGFRLFNRLDLKEQNITVTPVFTRYQGTFELLFWMHSVYELIDFRTMFLQFMGGYGRYVRPEFFWSYLILPDKIINYRNDQNAEIDWGNTDATLLHVETINKRKRSIPFPIDAIWKLESLNDNSSKYGNDQIAEYKLSATCNYEVNIPTYVVLDPGVLEDCLLSFNIGKTITKYPLCKPIDILEKAGCYDKNLLILNQRSSKYYTIPKTSLDNALTILEFNSDSFIYPKKSDFTAWCPIYNGKLKLVTSTTENSYIEKGDIILFDKYSPNYISFLRRSSCAISKLGRIENEAYDKCVLLKKGIISNFSDSEFEILKNYDGRDVTVDVSNKKIYLGTLPIEEDLSLNVGFERSERVKELNPELYAKAVNGAEAEYNLPENTFFEWISSLTNRAITDSADGLTTVFPIKYPLKNENIDKISVYINDNREVVETFNRALPGTFHIADDRKTLTFNEAPIKGSKIYLGIEIAPIRDVSLYSVYEFTEEDEDRKTDNPLIIDLPEGVKYLYELVPVTYFGKMTYDTDYEIDFDTNKITIKAKAKAGEVIEFFTCLIN